MKKKRVKKSTAVLLSLAMILGLMPAVTKPLQVQAQENAAPTATQFATQTELLGDYNLTTGTIARIKFGADNRTWLIAGEDAANEGENEKVLAVLSTASFGKSIYGLNNIYGGSTVRYALNGYSSDTTYFSTSEQSYMKSTTVTTVDNAGTSHNDTDKLYLADTKYGRGGYGSTSICVGKSNNIEIPQSKLTSANGFSKLTSACGYGFYPNGLFWLRSPENNSSCVLLAMPGGSARDYFVNFNDMPYYPDLPLVDPVFDVVPAVDLNLSSIILASAASAASSDGELSTKTDSKDNAFTLRYKSNGSETAVVNAAGTAVSISGASSGMYLVIQNSVGAYAKAVDSSTTSVSASEISGIANFNNCEVWLESTDTTNRITTATRATQSDPTPTPSDPTPTPSDPSPTPSDPTLGDSPKVTAGAGEAHETGTDGSLQITCSGALKELTGVYVDGVLVSESNYTLKSGSTILTLKPDYLNSLGGGTHTLRFQYSGKYADTSFVIKAADTTDSTLSKKDEGPKTGDNTPVVWLFISTLVSGAGVLYFGRKKKAVR